MYTGIGEDFYNALVKTKHSGLLFCESLQSKLSNVMHGKLVLSPEVICSE